MALQLTFNDPFGRSNPQSYWYPPALALDTLSRECVVTFLGYADAEAADSGKQPVGTKQIRITGDDLDALLAEVLPTVLPLVYAKAQADPFFAGAEVV